MIPVLGFAFFGVVVGFGGQDNQPLAGPVVHLVIGLFLMLGAMPD
jgi:hypothetical protein